MTPTVDRNVILDLLPLYVAGEASAETVALVEAWLREDPELQQAAREARVDFGTSGGPGAVLPPDLELRSLRRTRALLRWQRLAFSWAVAFTCLSLATVISFEGGTWHVRLLLLQFPRLFIPCVAFAVSGWIHYFFFVQRRLVGRRRV